MFGLSEVSSIKYDPKTREETVTPGEVNVEFGLKEWAKVVESKGQLEKLGVKLRKDAPVEGFDAYFRRNYNNYK
jgi:hypothetical protein